MDTHGYEGQMAERLGNRAGNRKVAGSIPGLVMYEGRLYRAEDSNALRQHREEP